MLKKGCGYSEIARYFSKKTGRKIDHSSIMYRAKMLGIYKKSTVNISNNFRGKYDKNEYLSNSTAIPTHPKYILDPYTGDKINQGKISYKAYLNEEKGDAITRLLKR